MAKAQALIEKVQRDLESGDQQIRNQGLDPQKVRTTLQDQLTPQASAEARAAFEADMAAVDQEVGEERARASFATPARSSGGPRRPRSMI
ncbi:hypothetical protein [Comamonas antarctica]|nr:hypothetical protein [Comamonas antarctica]